MVGPQEVVDGGSAVCWLFGANGGVDCVDAVQRVVPRHQLIDGRQRGGGGKGALSRVVVQADDGRLGNGPLNASPLKTRRQVVLFATRDGEKSEDNGGHTGADDDANEDGQQNGVTLSQACHARRKNSPGCGLPDLRRRQKRS